MGIKLSFSEIDHKRIYEIYDDIDTIDNLVKSAKYKSTKKCLDKIAFLLYEEIDRVFERGEENAKQKTRRV